MIQDEDHSLPPEPPISPALLTFLRHAFPLEGFKNCGDLNSLFTYRGAHEVIDLLQVLHDRQQNPDDEE